MKKNPERSSVKAHSRLVKTSRGTHTTKNVKASHRKRR